MKNERQVSEDMENTSHEIVDLMWTEDRTIVRRISALNPELAEKIQIAIEKSRLEGRLEALQSVQKGTVLPPTPLAQQMRQNVKG